MIACVVWGRVALKGPTWGHAASLRCGRPHGDAAGCMSPWCTAVSPCTLWYPVGAHPISPQVSLLPSLQRSVPWCRGHGGPAGRAVPWSHRRDDPTPQGKQHQNCLDQLLDAGLYTGEVTELAGAPGSGKTQVCLSIAASVSLGLRQHVVFLDSTGGFTASRLYQMLQARVEDKEEQLEALQRVQVVRVFDVYEMLRALHEVRDCLSQQVGSSAGPLKAVLIDSVSAVLSPLLGGRQSEGLAIMMQLAQELKTLAKEFSVAVVVTNQVTRDSSTGALKSALGRSWSFVPSTRVLLQGRAAPWEEGTAPLTACLAKSPRQPTGMQVQLDIDSDCVQEQRPVTPTP
uniref:DNA repair protein RAD51 homolog 4 n=1 Tax=Phasianus colchicus TaxID=9054 RepID=A0A669PAX4_PHACC